MQFRWPRSQPRAEVDIDASLVRQLLREQHPDLADLSVAWMLLPPARRPDFRAAACNAINPIDDNTWMRARGWALTLGVAYLVYSHDDEAMGALGKATIDTALEEE
jgi:hypothetical protein